MEEGDKKSSRKSKKGKSDLKETAPASPGTHHRADTPSGGVTTTLPPVPPKVSGETRVTVAGVAEVLELDRESAWKLLKVLETVGLVCRDGKEKLDGAKVAVDVYVLLSGWQGRFAERLSGLG